MKKNEPARRVPGSPLGHQQACSLPYAGFTLVEIAIVLIVVGVLLAVVVNGQQVATASKAKTLFASQVGVRTVINLYQDRFRAVPGDDARASGRFSAAQCGAVAAGTNACANGDGSGAIVGAYTDRVAAAAAATVADGPNDEVSKLWQHLRAAGLIRVDGTSFFENPRHGVGGVLAVAGPTPAGGNTPFVGMASAPLYLVFTGLPPDVAQALDAAADDGFANRGYYRGVANGTPTNPNSDPLGINYNGASLGIVAAPLF
jgi:prepilin-type N-terminal cleavage/methylation domain-containing protein